MADPAVEALLESLLRETQRQGAQQAQIFSRLARASGIDPKIVDNTQAKLKILGDSADVSSQSTGKMARAGQIAGSALADLTQGLVSTAGSLINFGKAAFDGSAKLSDFIGAFSNLPLIGTLASFVAGLQRIQESNYIAFQRLSESGINFGEGLMRARTDAVAFGMGLEEYVKFLKDNAESMKLFGDTTTVGARNLKGFMNELINGSTGDGLRNLGFSTQELANLTISYGKVVGGLTRQQQKDMLGTSQAMALYGEQLDYLARITGQSRESAAKALEKEMEEANWQAFLATKSADTRKKLEESVQRGMMLLGEGGAQIAKAQAMGIAVQGEQGRLQTSLFGQTADMIRRTTREAGDSNISVSRYIGDRTRWVADAQVRGAEEYERVQRTMGITALQQNSVLSRAADPLARTFQQLNNASTRDYASNLKRLQAEAAQQALDKATADAELDAQKEMQQAIREFSKVLNEVITPLMEEVLTPLLYYMLDNKDGIIEGFQALVTGLTEFVPKLFTPEGRQQIIDGIVKEFQNILKAVHQALLDDMFGKGTVESRPGGTGTPAREAPTGGATTEDILRGIWNYLGGGRENNSSAPAGKSLGSWGTTGKLFENFGNGTPIMAHGEEGMFKPDQIQALMDGSATMALKDDIQRLNSTNAEMLRTMKEIATYSKRNIEATKGLSGNIFA